MLPILANQKVRVGMACKHRDTNKSDVQLERNKIEVIGMDSDVSCKGRVMYPVGRNGLRKPWAPKASSDTQELR